MAQVSWSNIGPAAAGPAGPAPTALNCDAMIVSCLQLVSRHVIEVQEIGFKRFGTELRIEVGLQHILAGSVITCLEPLLNSISSSGVVLLHLKEIFLGLGVTVTNIKKEDLKNIKNVKGCRDGMPKSMQTR